MWARNLVAGAVARPTAVMMVGIVTLVCAWGLSTRPFSSADEPAQYLRALAVAHGDIVMAKPDGDPVAIAHREQPRGLKLSPAGYRTEALNTRVLPVSAAMSPPPRSERCTDGSADAGSGRCLEATYNGTYSPVGYLLPAVGLAVSGSASVGLWLGRLGSALGALAFLLLAVALASRGGRWSILGLSAALSPAILFWSAMLNPDGIEIAASLAFACGCLRLARERGALPGWAMAAIAVSGAVTIVVWALGPLYVLVDLGLLILLMGRRTAGELLAARRGPLTACGGVLIAALGLYLGWAAVVGRTHGGVELSPFLPSLHQALHQLSLVWKQSVGTFSWTDLPLPDTSYRGYLAVIAFLVALALGGGDRRDRVLMAIVVIVAVLFPVMLYQWLLRPPSDQGVQGRYVLPVLMLVPLLAGDVLSRRAGRLASWLSRLGPALGMAVLSLIGLGALVAVARFEAAAPGPLFAHARWAPPLGWTIWLLLVMISAACFLVAGIAAVLAPGTDRADRGRSGSRTTKIRRVKATV